MFNDFFARTVSVDLGNGKVASRNSKRSIRFAVVMLDSTGNLSVDTWSDLYKACEKRMAELESLGVQADIVPTVQVAK